MRTWFADLKIRRKLLFLCAVIIAAGATATALGIVAMVQMVDRTETMVSENTELAAYEAAKVALLEEDLLAKRFLLTGDGAHLTKQREISQAATSLLRELQRDVVENDEERSSIDSVLEHQRQYEELFAIAAKRFTEDGREAALDLARESDIALQRAHETITEISADARRDIDAAVNETAGRAWTASLLGAVTLLFSTAFAWFAAVRLARMITGPIAQLRDVAEKVSLGEVDCSIPVTSRDETGDLAAAFERMVVAVRVLLAEDPDQEEAKAS